MFTSILIICEVIDGIKSIYDPYGDFGGNLLKCITIDFVLFIGIRVVQLHDKVGGL